MMPQNVIHWGVGKQSHLCLSSESIPQPRRNKPSLLLYDCVCVVSWPEDLAVRSHIRPNRKVYKKKGFVDLWYFLQRNDSNLCQIHAQASAQRAAQSGGGGGIL